MRGGFLFSIASKFTNGFYCYWVKSTGSVASLSKIPWWNPSYWPITNYRRLWNAIYVELIRPWDVMGCWAEASLHGFANGFYARNLDTSIHSPLNFNYRLDEGNLHCWRPCREFCLYLCLSFPVLYFLGYWEWMEADYAEDIRTAVLTSTSNRSEI